MAETIWKYRLTPAGNNDYFAQMPHESLVLSVDFEGDDFVAWAIVRRRAESFPSWFHIAGTDHPIPDGLRRLGLLNRVDVRTPSALLRFHAFHTGDWRTGVDHG